MPKQIGRLTARQTADQGHRYREFTLKFSTDGGQTMTTLFGDIAFQYSIKEESTGRMSVGEGVKLGNFAGDTMLSFFLQNPLGRVFGADASKKPFWP
ncbi:hypothetical protein IQ241_08225 [Romeria aff. gracilis LEGE 07310]|uniref:Uncharacterized protein n=1 Tax=Vasconcelosia minhoensis LEGE 07310 TaxID=915328 RepID=A0A8J7AMY9_9CYAN|nr:hypothetical protein [Romeria gracilis]MBE9077281.1 hypothetical protein [Romeria aff. gracilis LEGE 07310]